MCIGIPMQVTAIEAGHAWVEGRGEQRLVNTSLIGDCSIGDYLLIFLNDAREKIDAQHAYEINATLDLLSNGAHGIGDALAPASFVLPSQISTEELVKMTASSKTDVSASTDIPQ